MKNLFMTFALLLIYLNSSFSAPRKIIQGSKVEVGQIAFEINLPSRNVDGRYFPTRKVAVKKLADEFVYQNVIEVKTKSFESINLKSSKFDNPELQNTLSYLNISKIQTPYADYVRADGFLSNDKFGVSRIYKIEFKNDINPFDACREIMQNPDVEYATPVYKRNLYSVNPDDAWFSLQYHLTKISMPEAWDITKGDTNVVIAIVDSGTDINHDDLKKNIWTNPKEIPNNGKDDDGNGKIDDVNGWDMIGAISAQQLSTGAYAEDNNPVNMVGTHGTHTAGCASAVTNNTLGVAAPGYNCRIMPVKCASDAYESPGISRGYEGILYAARTGAKVINCSWGGPGWSPSEEDVVNQAIAYGALIVAASGNSGMNMDLEAHYPGGFKGVMSVGSSGATDRASNFANYGNLVRVFAPGENIWSTLPGNKYEAQSGTSMASPVAAGVAALILSIHKNWTPEQVIHQMRSTCDNVLTTTNPSLRPYYFGRINAAKALQYNYQQGKTIAGIGLESVSVDNGNNSISNYELNPVKIKLKNYLAKDNNIKVRIIPVDNFIEFDKNIYEVGTIDNFETKDLAVNARLLDNNPWYKGTADIILEITGTDYVNYELAKINIFVPSNNRLTTLSSLSSAYQINWHSSALLGNDMIYVVGESPYIGGFALKASKTGSSVIQVNSQAIYCMYAFNESNLIAGDGPTNGAAKIYNSTNGGTTWTSKPITTITGFVNSFNFFNAFEGLLLGDPLGVNWGVGKTNDAGATWKLATGLPAPIGTETGLVGSVYQDGNSVWFGTTAGRIFSTNDKGETWSTTTVIQGGVVQSVAMNETLAACLYSPTNTQGADRLLAISKDGGKTWTTAVYNFTGNKQIPLMVYAVKETKTIIVQLYDGTLLGSDNEGIGWYPILSEEKSAYTYATANQVGNKVSVFSAGTDITRLEFTYTPAVIKKSIAVIGGNLVMFDSVAVNSTKDMTIEIKNVGNTPVSISNISILPDDGTEQNEFRVLLPAPNTVNPGTPATLRIRFSPKEAKIKTARVKILSDAENSELTFDLIGYGTSGTSADYQNLANDFFYIVPNPVSDAFTIFNAENIIIQNVKIVNLVGTVLMSIENWTENSIADISKLSEGVYFVVISTDKGVINHKITVVR